MTSHDLRDVLSLPSDQAAGPRPTKKQKINTPRPNLKGLAREVQNLSGDNPISIVPEVNVFKKRRYASRKPAARWEHRAFFNSGRGDDGALVLRHWRRKEEAETTEPAQNGGEERAEGAFEEEQKPQMEDSAFAKYNVRVAVPQYSEDQYSSNLENANWTKEETDYLLELARDYDLRWPIIWDRYEFTPKSAPGETSEDTSKAVVPVPQTRTVEDLKARYYEVAAKMMAVQKPAQYMTRPEFELYEIMQNFDPVQEKARKEFALNTMSRSKDEAREEEALLLEIKRILARTERFNEERRELYNRLDYPATDADISTFKGSQGLQLLLHNLMNVDKSKKRRPIGPGDGQSPATAVPGSAASESAPHRRESIAASVPGHRDSIAGTPATPVEPAPATNKKKGAPQPERRKLTTLEEQTYGVSYHDRLGSGPTFRYEKINKLYSHKSGQQQARITNVLAELDIPARLAMPTATVSQHFESLWGAVIKLVDLRKTSDRLDADIKLEEAKLAEIAKSRAAKGDDGPSVQKSVEGPNGTAAGPSEKPSAVDGGGAGTDGDKAGEATIKQEQTEGMASPSSRPSTRAGGGDPAPDAVEGQDKDRLSVRPGSSGAHKRSASVLSTTSDKSTKRQKK
jgi:DNA methyltransferase 1-associated protein 1